MAKTRTRSPNKKTSHNLLEKANELAPLNVAVNRKWVQVSERRQMEIAYAIHIYDTDGAKDHISDDELASLAKLFNVPENHEAVLKVIEEKYGPFFE